MTVAPLKGADLDLRMLEREFDRTKTHVFMGSSAGFYGPLLCYMNFVWTEDVPTAGVGGTTFYWNPYWFLRLPEETRKTVLVHELEHIAYLHELRRGERDPLIWNYACDVWINNGLEQRGYSFAGTNPWKGHKWPGETPEQIYESMMIEASKPQPGMDTWGHAIIPGTNENDPHTSGDAQEQDMMSVSPEEQLKATTSVVQATHAARMAGAAGDIPGETEQVLKQFLAPIIPWETVLWKFFQDLIQEDFSWMKRDRRFNDMYLPGEDEDEGLLDHLFYAIDVSGSVTDAQVIRFNSEIKYIKDVLQPKKLTVAQFDTRITDVKVFLQEDPFEELVVIGRGGTDLAPVRAWIMEHKPTAAVIFSDLYCATMEDIPGRPPLIWVAISNTSAQVPYGTLIHIKG